MIDFPNLIAGFLLGLVPTLALWGADRARQKSSRRQDVLDQWRGVAKEIELLLFKKDTTSATLYAVRTRYPLDTWRTVLGPDHFRALEDVERAFHRAEHMPAPSQLFFFGNEPELPETDADRERKAIWEARRQAINTFSNTSRGMQDEAYALVTDKEDRERIRADYKRHPLKTWRRERRNRLTRRP